MKNSTLSFLLLTFISITTFHLATAQTIIVSQASTTQVSKEYSNTILQKWFIDNQIAGKTISNAQDAKNLISFPLLFKNFNIRILRINSVMTMDFSSERINFILDKNNHIEQVTIG